MDGPSLKLPSERAHRRRAMKRIPILRDGPAGRARVHQQLGDCVLGDAGHADGGAEGATLDERRNHRLHPLVGQLIETYIALVTFTIELEPEADGRWLAEISALPGVMCYGADRREAVARVQALALRVIAERLEHREAPSEFVDVKFQAA